MNTGDNVYFVDNGKVEHGSILYYHLSGDSEIVYTIRLDGDSSSIYSGLDRTYVEGINCFNTEEEAVKSLENQRQSIQRGIDQAQAGLLSTRDDLEED